MAIPQKITELQLARVNNPEDQRRATELLLRKLNELIRAVNQLIDEAT
jgi:hypothetical protein